MANAAPFLLFLPSILFALKANLPRKENTTTYPDPFPVEVPTLEEFFYSFYQDGWEVDGEKVNIHDALKAMRSMVKNMEKNLQTAKEHLKKMQIAKEIALVVMEYESNQEDKEFPEVIIQEKMRDILFLVAITDDVDFMEKLGIFFTIIESYPEFDKVVKGAIDVATEYRYTKKYLSTVSRKVEMAYTLALKTQMVFDDPEGMEELEDRLGEVIATFTEKDHDEMTLLTIKILESKANLKPANIVEELRETLKY